MAKGNSQLEMFSRSKKPVIEIDPNHFFVVLTNLLDWTSLIEIVQTIRKKKLKNMAGRPPKIRATLGAVIFMSLRDLTYRDTEDYIRHYGPARYLCGLTETTWTPDFTTIQDFTELMGEEGIRKINEEVVLVAKREKLADPRVAVADMTAQEASIPHPREIGLMSSFLQSLGKCCSKAGKKVEFGVLWGIERIKGGFVIGRMAQVGERLHDTKYVLEAVSNHKTLFGNAPEVYGYDRGGYRPAIPEKLRKLGVKHVGVAPQGQANWEVSGKIKKQIQSERAKVEGSIGIVKGRKYGFNKPRARSYGMMGACGQRALLGLNLNNYVRGLAKRENIILEC